MGRRRGTDRVVEQVDTGQAELVPDPDRPGSWTLLLDGAPQSHVDLADPTHLEFEYVRRLAAAIDLVAPAGAPLRVLHLGGGALTLPRYVSATRPGSTQRVSEVDGALVELVRRALPWPADARLRVRVADARATLTASREASYDLVVADVFAGARTPAHLTSVEYAAEVARVLRPAGFYLANIADGPPLRHARAQVATVRTVLPRACLVSDAAVLRGRRYGNLVLVASRVDPPVAELSRRAAGDWFPGRVLAGEELDRFAGGAPVVRDAEARDSTPPPPGIFSVRR
ncbi:fused MFS/spermidine synthase [Micromonospora sp. DR5-3]|uniref:spermidine synthase n=1 Tax=unclassified Micromonospora TaxID=2617518 RepID=UPI0011D3EE46|nr:MULTISPECIES: fused MFS/spermidine synthase [unclassified Micromonospora]MCW3813265.1 fused MFS/spermidine synthase [Micromonospora sp. DR5-3]TYC24655.1 spermine synthase [Micromonospora sp. MP36]